MFQQLIRSRRGQGMAEYAILFAIVLGAAIAMQYFVKSRLQGAIAGTSDAYATQSVNLGGYFTYEPPTRTSSSSSAGNMTFTTAKTGTVDQNSNSNTNTTK